MSESEGETPGPAAWEDSMKSQKQKRMPRRKCCIPEYFLMRPPIPSVSIASSESCLDSRCREPIFRTARPKTACFAKAQSPRIPFEYEVVLVCRNNYGPSRQSAAHPESE